MRPSGLLVSLSLVPLALARAFPPARLESRKEGSCSSAQPSASAPHKNFWGSLTKKETADVLAFLHRDATGFNLTVAENATSRDNKIMSVELMMPNKSDTLPFLSDKAGSPTRYALAAVMFGVPEKAYLQEFKVGPLPITNASVVTPFTFANTKKGDGKISVVNPDAEDYGNFNLKIMKEAEDVTKRLWNLTVDDGLQIPLAFAAPINVTDGKVIMWQGFNAPVTSIYDTISLLPLGLYLRTDITGRDPSQWKVTGWVYGNEFYKDLDGLRAAVAKPDFKPLGMNLDQPWAHTNKHGDDLPLDDEAPPANVQSGKSRFAVDEDESYVTWMDFSFYTSITRDNGLRLYDVKYKGKRILYELGLDEAIAHYAGIDPVQSGICYFDSMSGFGPAMISLVKGYDCPAYSHYTNVTQTTGETTFTQKDALCMFEIDKGFPIQRHSWAGHTTVTKNIAFNIRAIYTIGNYDYMLTYQFHLDGSIEVDVRASGYISSAFYAENEDYGFKIHDSLSGSLHDHVITFKADFDILGEKNSLQKIDIKPSTEKYKWSDQTRNTMKAVKSFIDNEDDAKINWSPNGATMYAVVNKDEKNPYGESPGYRVAPASGVAYLTVQDSSVMQNAGHHTTHHLYATRQKDNELYAVGAYNSLTPKDPQVDFNEYFNSESLDQEDIVLWFNLGMHHMPHTGDLPNTVFSTAHSAMLIEPFNYLMGDPSQASSQQVLIKTKKDGKPEIVTYGAKNATCAIDMAQLNPDLSDYSNSISVLKYPFDGSKPDRL